VNDDLVTRLLEVTPGQLWALIVGVLLNPSSNPTAFMLVLALITGVVLLIVLVLVLIVLRESARMEPQAEGAVPPRAQDAAERDAEPPTPPTSTAREVRWYVTQAVWIVIFGVVWVAGGYVSGRDAVCLSCHADDSIHTARFEAPQTDPHVSVRCVYCHETAHPVATLTTAVVSRAVHITSVAFDETSGAGYGAPTPNRACAYCHSGQISVTTENQERGVRMSHAEPLEAGALCGDCHVPHSGTGVVDRYTVGMDPCMRCHDAQIASARCEDCHTKDFGFAVRARSAVEPRAHVDQVECGACHDEVRECDVCHGLRLPHTREFMGPGHARVAVEDIWFNDGRTCQGLCHTPTRRPCMRCHQGTFPSHPSPSFAREHQAADPFNNGCDQCHGYLEWRRDRNFCANCHPRYAPGEVPIPRDR